MCISNVIDSFDGISLKEMDSVKLMNRTDRKYWFNATHLTQLLESVKDYYYILDIDGERNMLYTTTYYDTLNDEMYNNHHRGKLNRFKIRRRNYHSTKCSFLEIKFKNNKGRTIKQRRASNYENYSFDNNDNEFIKENTPYSCNQLKKVLENGFKRLTLVSKNMNERCTIDSELLFISNNREARLDSLVVVEVKRDGREKSVIIDALNNLRLKPSGFSKYCMGRSITDRTLKINRFKGTHREIEKKIDTAINNLLQKV